MSSHLARSIGSLWHRLLLFLGIRNEFDWAPPGLGPEVNHPYGQHPTLRCCEHCGGGLKHWIHRPPYDPRRTAEVLTINHDLTIDLMENLNRQVELQSGQKSLPMPCAYFDYGGVELPRER